MELRDHCKSIFYWLFVASVAVNVAQWYFDHDGNINSKMERDVQGLIKNTTEFYQYRVNPDNNTLSDQELMLQGGDCKDWSEFYNRTLSDMGYETKTISYFPRNKEGNITKGHEFMIVYSTEGYCTIDALNYRCYKSKMR